MWVTPSAPPASDVVIPITLTAGTAEPGDYGSLSSITLAAGNTIAVGILSTMEDDDLDDETFTVSLGTLPSSVTAGEPDLRDRGHQRQRQGGRATRPSPSGPLPTR